VAISAIGRDAFSMARRRNGRSCGSGTLFATGSLSMSDGSVTPISHRAARHRPVKAHVQAALIGVFFSPYRESISISTT
jgi:hypothetical protein